MNMILRNDEVIRAYVAGQTVTSIAERHAISRQRVNQIVRGMGLAHRRSGMAAVKRDAAAVAKSERMG